MPRNPQSLRKSQSAEIQVGRARLHLKVDGLSDTPLQVELRHKDGRGEIVEQRTIWIAPMAEGGERRNGLLQRLKGMWTRLGGSEVEKWMFGLALLVYLFTRLIALPQFPVYFFTDEAVQTVLAADLWRDGWRGADKVLLPTYFFNAYQYNLGVSVYLQVLPYLLFGKSIWVTRGVSALVSLLAALATGLTLRKVFKVRHAWVGVLLLSITPAWFLHSRTAFETVIATSFYAMFLYFYLRYRGGWSRALYAAVVMAALAFYSYSPMRLVVLLTASFLFVSDLRYHLNRRAIVLKGLGLTLLLALPQVRFQFQHPQAFLEHLTQLNSYWVAQIPLWDKARLFLVEYGRGFDPFYWFLGQGNELPRHMMQGYGQLLRTSFPFVLAGIGLAMKRVQRWEYRAVLLALLAAPTGAALVGVGVTRLLPLVIPVGILTSLALVEMLGWLERQWLQSFRGFAWVVFAVMAGFNGWMLADALTNAPLWYTNYGLYGMQWGAREVFGEVRAILRETPQTRIILSPSWANGTDTIARFFFDDPLPFTIGSIEGYFDEKKQLDENMLFIMIPEEYDKVLKSEKFTDVRVERILFYPNGQPGFYFVRLRYAANIDDILEAERKARQVLREAWVRIDDAPAQVKYSYLDAGAIEMIFDGDLNTLMRTMEANPLQVQITFKQERTIRGLTAKIGGEPTRLVVELRDAAGKTLLKTGQEVSANPTPRLLTLEFEEVSGVAQVWLDVFNLNEPAPTHVHLWEVSFR